MSAVFQSGISNLGSRAVAKATKEADAYNQKLQKREMVSQTEESLGGLKLFTSGRELGAKIIEKSKIKPYLKQQAEKAFGKAKEAGTKAIKKATDAADEAGDDAEAAASEVTEDVTPIVPELKLARNVSNDFSDARLARFGRLAKLRKARKIQQGMSEEEAEEDQNAYIQQRVTSIMRKDNLNNQAEQQANDANEAAQSEAKAAADARAALKARSAAKVTEEEGGDEAGAEGGEEAASAAAKAAAEGEEISGSEVLSSILDVIPGLDVIGAALGIGGLAAGFAKKAPNRMTGNPNMRSNASYSQQLGIDN